MAGWTRSLVVCVVLLACGAAPILAQEPEGVTRTPAGIEFDFQDADFRVVASALAEVAGLNVIFGNLPARRVTLRTSRPLREDEVRSYLENVVQANGFAMLDEDGLIRIMDTGGVGPAIPRRGVQQVPSGAVRLFVYPLHHAEAEVLARTLGALFGFGDMGLTGAREPESLTEQLRGQRLPPGLPPQAELPAPVPGRPTEGLAVGLQGPVQVVPDARTNSLLIRSTQADYATLEAAIQQLDVRPLQVIIEVLILEVRRDRQLGLGIDVTVPDQTIGDGPTTIGGELIGRGAGDVTLRVLGLGGVRADVILRALAASADVTILSRPIIVTENNQEARILVGSQRPFVQLFRSLPTDAAVRDQVVQYRDVGTQLTIRPTINPNGYVSLAVLQEVSNATAETQFGAPVISTREARTRLLVRDGQTIVIGGLIEQQRELTASGLPFLKDIPVLGWLFRSTQVRRGTTELFLFLTPYVVQTDTDIDETTRQIQERSAIERGLRENTRLLVPDTLPPPPSDARRRTP